MTTKGKRPLRALAPGDKIEAIERVTRGESKAAVARDIGVPESTLRGWCKNEDKLRYMTSRLSSSDTDKSSDGEPPEKRARTISSTASPAASPSSITAGLDLTATAAAAHSSQIAHSSQGAPVPSTSDSPVELTTKRTETTSAPTPRELWMDPDPKVSIADVSPTPYACLPSRAHVPHSLSYNDINTNLTMQLLANSALRSRPASRALRSVRSPKPAHNGALSGNSGKYLNKNHVPDSFRSIAPMANLPPVDESQFWNLLQFPFPDLNSAVVHNSVLQKFLLEKLNGTNMPKPVTPIAPLNFHHDYPTNSRFYTNYKQGGVPMPEEKPRSASQVPNERTAENILYAHLTKGKFAEDHGASVSPSHTQVAPNETARQTTNETPSAVEPVGNFNAESKDSAPENNVQKNQNKVRNVLDNLLFKKTIQANNKNATNAVINDGELKMSDAEALECGWKFLAWIEACGDPSVTHIHVHQLSALLQNLRSRRGCGAATAEHSNRRK